jgi:ankyrin repeat protein
VHPHNINKLPDTEEPSFEMDTPLDKGGNVYTQGGYFGTALQAACSQGHQHIVVMLLAEGAGIHAQTGYFGIMDQFSYS